MAEKEDEKYEVLEKIGQGSFGVIRKVRVKATGQILCRKEISYSRMSDKEKTQLHAELRILESLRHPSIVQYCHREHLKSSHDLHLYMEYCGNGDLGGYVKKLRERNQYADEEFVWAIFAQLVGALYRCHYGEDPPPPGEESKVAKGRQPFQTKEGYRVILHRDLKPENVFLGENNTVKLGDFGLSKIIASHDFASTYVGTPFYMSPEICAAERYSHHSDIWSLGCIIYELASRGVPFDARNHVELIMKIKAGRIKALPAHYSRELSEVISWCLKVDPRARPDTALLLNMTNIMLARARLQVLQERQSVQPLQQERDAALAKLVQTQAQVIELKHEVQRLREAGKKVEMEWHARATLAIDQRVHEQVEAHKAELLKQFSQAVDQRADEKLTLHLASLPSSHGLNSGDSTHVRSCTPPPGKAASFATIATNFTSGRSSRADDSTLDTDLTSLSINEDADEIGSPLAQRAKPIKKTRKPLGRAKTYAHGNLDTASTNSPMDVQMADPSPMPSHVAPMSIKGLSLSPRKNGQDRYGTSAGLRRDIFNRGHEHNLRPAVPGEAPAAYNSDEDHFLDDDVSGLLESPSRPTSGSSNHSNPLNGGDPFKTLAAPPAKTRLLSRPSLMRQKTMPVGLPATTRSQRPNIFAAAAAAVSRPSSPGSVRNKENRPPSSLSSANTTATAPASPSRTTKKTALTPSRKAPAPPTTTTATTTATAAAQAPSSTATTGTTSSRAPAYASKTLGRGAVSPSRAQGRTLVQLQQARSQPSLLDREGEAADSVAFALPSVPRLPPPSPAKWDPVLHGEEMPSPFLAKRFGTLRSLVRG